MAPHKCNECIHTIFHEACKNGDVDKVIACTTVEVDINCKTGEFGYSGLHHAANANSVEVLEFLLTQPNIDVNIKDDETLSTPLITACDIGHGDIVRRLCLDPRIDLNYKNRDGNTAAKVALSKKQFSYVQELSEIEGVDWNTKNAGKLEQRVRELEDTLSNMTTSNFGDCPVGLK